MLYRARAMSSALWAGNMNQACMLGLLRCTLLFSLVHSAAMMWLQGLSLYQKHLSTGGVSLGKHLVCLLDSLVHVSGAHSMTKQ